MEELGWRAWVGVVGSGLALVAGCSREPARVVLLPSETFHWAEQPISFSPPPEGWRREGYGQGGLSGVMFIKTGSVGEGITIAVHRVIADRDRTAEIRDLLERYDAMTAHERSRELRVLTRNDPHFSAQEAQVAAAVDDEIRSADTAQRAGDNGSAKFLLQSALHRSENLQLTLRDVIQTVVFQAESHTQPDSFLATVRRDTTVSGRETVLTDYEFHGPERVYRGREYWWMERNHPFTAQYIGLEENVAVFDTVVATITFPPRSVKPLP
jgi:hypothetical protein